MFKENINDKPESKSSVTSQDSGLALESYGPLPSTPQITFRESECAYIVQIDALCTLSVRKVSQVIPGGQQEGEHEVVHQVQGERYKRKF